MFGIWSIIRVGYVDGAVIGSGKGMVSWQLVQKDVWEAFPRQALLQVAWRKLWALQRFAWYVLTLGAERYSSWHIGNADILALHIMGHSGISLLVFARLSRELGHSCHCRTPRIFRLQQVLRLAHLLTMHHHPQKDTNWNGPIIGPLISTSYGSILWVGWCPIFEPHLNDPKQNTGGFARFLELFA